MRREDLIQGVTDYFVLSDHWRRLMASLQGPDPEGTHIHAYVNTCIHPKSLETVITGYLDLRGWPSVRRIDHMSPVAGMGSLHGIEPKGKPHFDFQWFFKEDVPVKPTDGGEGGCNLLVWNRWYINEFYREFKFREVGPAEEKQLEDYFYSDHWERGLEIAARPDTTHMHINVETSVHPDQIARFAKRALEEKAWKIYYVCPNVYLVKGKYRGKLVFMGRDPEEVYDIGWHFNPEVVLEPARDTWIFEENPGYDVWPKRLLDDVMQHPYHTLEPEDVKSILKSCEASLT